MKTAQPTSTYSETLAAHCLQLQPSASDISKAKLCIYDLLSCAFAGRSLPWSKQAIASIGSTGNSSGRSPIIGHSIFTDSEKAAFVNAVLGHSLVRDDMHLGSVSHLGTVILPVLFALTTNIKVSGAEFLGALIAGYEAGGQLGRAVLDTEVARIHRPTGITGPVAAAAAASRLLSLSHNQTAAAIGIAANTAAGYNEWAATGGSEMFFQPGFAARAAVSAVVLAQAGAQVSRSAVDGPAGLLASFNKHNDALRVSTTAAHEIQAVFFKEVPACNFAQTPAQVARDIALQHRINTAEITSINAYVNYAAANYPGCDQPGPLEHMLQCKMSIQYNVAAALITGNFDEQNFQPEMQPEISALAQIVSIVVDDALTSVYPTHQAARLEIILRNGSNLLLSSKDVTPASDELVLRRFRSAAPDIFDSSHAADLEACINNLETTLDAQKLVSLLTAS